jgi:hypothetical protein
MLQRHGATILHPVGFLWNCAVNEPTVFAGHACFVANIDAAAHDVVPV